MARRHSPASPRQVAITVADVPIGIRSQYPVAQSEDSPYRPFVLPIAPRESPSAGIDVNVLVSKCPPSQEPVVFDSTIAWYMQTEADGYRVSYRRLDSESVHTVLCSDRETTRVKIYVHQDEAPPRPFSEGVSNPVHYPLDQVLLMNHLSQRGGVITHAAGAVVEGCALLFAGVSGAGKSTLARRFIEAGLGESLLSDDRVILRRPLDDGAGDITRAWGTPWPGDAMVARNESAPLAAVLFLVKAEVDEVVPVPANVAMRRLMPVVSCPWYDPERLPAVLETCAWVVETVPCYDLRFRPDVDVMSLLTGRSW